MAELDGFSGSLGFSGVDAPVCFAAPAAPARDAAEGFGADGPAGRSEVTGALLMLLSVFASAAFALALSALASAVLGASVDAAGGVSLPGFALVVSCALASEDAALSDPSLVDAFAAGVSDPDAGFRAFATLGILLILTSMSD